MSNEIRILEANLQRKPRAHDMLNLAAHDTKADILFTSEPNKRIVSGGGCIRDEASDVAVMVRDRGVQIKSIKTGRGYITLHLCNMSITCCYLSPNSPIEAFRPQAEEIVGNGGDSEEKIVLGDINAKSRGSPTWDRRGELWMELLDARDMVIMNDGIVPTWTRGNSTSFIDVTCATRGVAEKIEGWKVLPGESLSDHAFIYFTVRVLKRRSNNTMERKKFVDKFLLRESLIAELRSSGTTPRCGDLVRAMQRAQERSTIKRNDSRPGNFSYWWNLDIEQRRKECTAARRRLTRIRSRQQGNVSDEVYLEEYRDHRRRLAKAIKSSKREYWEEIRTDLEDDIWGRGYQIVTRDLKKKTNPTSYVMRRRSRSPNPVDDILFPTVDDRWDRSPRGLVAVPQVTENEVREAAARLKKKRCPGPDGVTTEALQEAVDIAPGLFASMLEELLRRGSFPRDWKIARLVLIWKGKMPVEHTCLINTTGKLFELVIKERLAVLWEGNDGLADRQFGFRKGRSTVRTAEFVQTLVEEARRDRSRIIGELSAKGTERYLVRIIEDYFQEREITVGKERLEMTTGVPEVLGPLLWNVL